jgi:uncharacterized protein (DUF1778 family)
MTTVRPAASRGGSASERSKSFRTKTLRLHPLENTIIDAACEALNGMERTQLVQEAVIFEAARLGIRWTAEEATPLRGPWPYLPDRGEEPTAVRVSITVSLPVAELISRAAAHVGASEPMFIIGATLAHIGRLQRCFQAVHADSPDEARAIRSTLEGIRLPAQYQYSRRARRVQ